MAIARAASAKRRRATTSNTAAAPPALTAKAARIVPARARTCWRVSCGSSPLTVSHRDRVILIAEPSLIFSFNEYRIVAISVSSAQEEEDSERDREQGEQDHTHANGVLHPPSHADRRREQPGNHREDRGQSHKRVPLGAELVRGQEEQYASPSVPGRCPANDSARETAVRTVYRFPESEGRFEVENALFRSSGSLVVSRTSRISG